jgi:hypothetical protein
MPLAEYFGKNENAAVTMVRRGGGIRSYQIINGAFDMKRTAINPSSWSQKFGFHQGEIIEGATRQLNVSGQGAMDAEGQPVHQGDMTLTDVTRIRILTTDMEATIANFDVLGK